MRENKLVIPRTARYYTLGTPSSNIQDLWIVCHGYGQLARFFLRTFNTLNDGRTLVVAPEAPSKFYLNGFSGRVGTSWMTKEDRLSEIKDQSAYLNLLLQEQLEQLPPDVRVTVFGFSQGGTMACRWLASAQLPVHRLILWAAFFPDDLDLSFGMNTFETVAVAAVYGTQDEFITPEILERQRQLVDALGIRPQVYTFDGGHTLDTDVLQRINRQLGRF
ncbi:alpha/beta hydrolase [Pontibacter chitinilyticus]|uniref:alpha/beta hydrolase n=1 Tax=Pontibacter chitinilyticus TaxID=2674989 RepID=UPI0032191DA2